MQAARALPRRRNPLVAAKPREPATCFGKDALEKGPRRNEPGKTVGFLDDVGVRRGSSWIREAIIAAFRYKLNAAPDSAPNHPHPLGHGSGGLPGRDTLVVPE